MFLTSGVSGAIAKPNGAYPYEYSQEGGTESTFAEGVESGAGPYAGPNTALTRPETDYYMPQATIAPINTVAPPSIPQGPNPYTNTGNASEPMTAPKPATDGCGCSGGAGCDCKKLPWYVLVGLVIGAILLLRAD